MADAQKRLLGNVKGDPGVSPTISFVTPDTLPPGSQATLQNLGTSANPVLKFGLVQGPPGAPGANGRNGVDGRDGESIEGPRGRAATLKINSVEMLDSDADPEIVSIGNETDAEYIIKLPRAVGSNPDDQFVDDSENTVQSKVIQSALAEKADISSVPTKLSELQNDSNYVSEPTVNAKIEDAVQAAVTAANPVDSEPSTTSTNALQNKVVTAALNQKVDMEIEDLLDDTDTKIGERLILENENKSISLNLYGEEIVEANILTTVVKDREPMVVASLPATGEETKLYLVPSGNNNYSMHLWMNVSGTMKYVGVSGGTTPDLVGLMGSTAKGSATQPIYWDGSSFKNTSFTVEKSVPSNADFSNTWVANSKTAAGYVASPSNIGNSFWGTDSNGNPVWHRIKDVFYIQHFTKSGSLQENSSYTIVSIELPIVGNYVPIIVGSLYVDPHFKIEACYPYYYNNDKNNYMSSFNVRVSKESKYTYTGFTVEAAVLYVTKK